MNIEFNSQQQKIVATAMTILAGAVIVTAIVLLFVYVARFLGAFSHVFLPLAVAGIFALVLEPWFNWLRDKARLPDVLAVVAVFLSLVIPIITILMFFGTLILEQFVGLIEHLPTLWENIVEWIQERRPKIDYFFKETTFGTKISAAMNAPGGSFTNISDHLLKWIMSASSGVASGVASLLVWIVAPVYLAFFLTMPKMKSDQFTSSNLPFLKPGTANDLIYLFHEFVCLVVSFFVLVQVRQGVPLRQFLKRI